MLACLINAYKIITFSINWGLDWVSKDFFRGSKSIYNNEGASVANQSLLDSIGKFGLRETVEDWSRERRGIDLSGIDLTGQDLSGLILDRVKLSDAKWRANSN